MTTERIEELTTELKALRVRETSIIEEIERENRSRRTTENRPRRATTAPPTELEVGARVYIKNNVRPLLEDNNDTHGAL
jgi:hypothetical protein